MDEVIPLDDVDGMYTPKRDQSRQRAQEKEIDIPKRVQSRQRPPGEDIDIPKRVQSRQRPQVDDMDTKPTYYNMPPVTSRHVTQDDGEEARPLAPDYYDSGLKRRKKRKKTEKNLYYRPLQYTIEQIPPWYICFFLALQHYMIMFGATLANPLVLADKMCIQHDDYDTKAQLVGTIFVVSGVCTLLQTTLGVRLPVVQGGTFTFVAPSMALLSLPEWKCPEGKSAAGLLDNTTDVYNMTVSYNDSMPAVGLTPAEPIFLSRIREIQGAIIVASMFQVLIGFTGLMGFMLRFIGPLAIAPTIALAGLALFEVAANYSSEQWWVSLVTVILIAAFSQYSRNIKIPCPVFERGTGCKAEPFPVFRLFPVILAMSITWIICAILTVAGAFPDPKSWGYGAKTNLQMDIFKKSSWFRVPYPGQWGMPTVSVAGVFGMLAGVLASMVESVGDYYACARMARVPPPPIHAVNRGIGIEGIGCVLAGAWGSGTGTTTYSENIGAIGITRVGSRCVIQCSALIMIVFGIVGKLGAIFVTIPKPITGGVFIVMFGMIAAVGISNLQFVDLNSSRNLFIIGFSFFFGLTLPNYMLHHTTAIQTGSGVMDQILTVLLSTSMFVGGLTGFVLDNTIPGTDEERGLAKWRMQMEVLAPETSAENSNLDQCYEIPRLTRLLEPYTWTKYMPFLPTYDPSWTNNLCRRKKRRRPRQSERTRDGGNPSRV